MFGRIDWDDRVMSIVFVIASGVNAGLLSTPIGVFDDVVYTLGSGAAAAEITAAKLIAIATLGGAVATNRTDWSRLSSIELWVAIATFGLVLAPPFMPLLEQLINQSLVAASVAVIIQAGGFYAISYLG